MKVRLLWLLLGLWGCDELPEYPPDYVERRLREPLSEGFNVDFRHFEAEAIKARLQAPHVEEMYVDDKFQVTEHRMDQGVTIEFFNAEGQPSSRITAQRGRYSEQRGMAVAQGDVVVINSQGDTLYTETLNWDRNKDRLYTNGFVRIQTPDETYLGDSLVSNTSFTEYSLYKFRGNVLFEE